MNKDLHVINFTSEELQRFQDALSVCYAFPFIDGIEDYIVEAVLEYARKIDGPDPVVETRSKKLYDVVDEVRHIGWSVKSIQLSNLNRREFELVIQRADIFKKANELGYSELNINTPPQILGEAVLKHWKKKVEEDAEAQNVKERRVFIMLKSKKPSRKYALYEAPLIVPESDDIIWRWTDESKSGLQGKCAKTGRTIFRWHPNQKQVFEFFTLPETTRTFEIKSIRFRKEEVVHLLKKHLQVRQ